MSQHSNSKVSLVEFLRSIKFSRRQDPAGNQECSTHFAGFDQHVRTRGQSSKEDSQLIRSAN